jgi:hypothetical protein
MGIPIYIGTSRNPITTKTRYADVIYQICQVNIHATFDYSIGIFNLKKRYSNDEIGSLIHCER